MLYKLATERQVSLSIKDIITIILILGPERLSLRVTRLIQDRKVMSDMEKGRIEMLRAYRDRRFASPLGMVRNL